MKTVKYIIIILMLFAIGLPNYGQDKTVILQPTPEQEAVKQTDKLQQELNLNGEQAKQVYEINLKYARERQISNTRSAAMERMKNKNAAIEGVLNEDQNYRLKTKRYERTTFEIPTENRSTTTNTTGFRSPSEPSVNPTKRTTTNDNNLRSSYRTTTPQNGSTTQQNQPLKRNTTTPTYTPRVLQPSTRSTSSSNNNTTPRPSINPTSSTQNNSNSSVQSTPTTSTQRGTGTTTTNRR